MLSLSAVAVALAFSYWPRCGPSSRLPSHRRESSSPVEPPKSVDLRPLFHKWALSPRRQGARGTCSVFTVVGALEYALRTEAESGARA